MLQIYIDANIFIYAVEGEATLARACRGLLEAVRAGRVYAATSELTLAEVLVRPARLNDGIAKRVYDALFDRATALVDLRPVTREILEASAGFRARYHPVPPDLDETRRNFLPDAIHVVTAMDAGVGHYAGLDRRVRLPPGIARLDPKAVDFDAILGRDP